MNRYSHCTLSLQQPRRFPVLLLSYEESSFSRCPEPLERSLATAEGTTSARDRFIPRCDFNQDHVVSMVDIGHVAHAFFAKYGDSRYESDLDLDGKLTINMIDIARTAAEFGQEY